MAESEKLKFKEWMTDVIQNDKFVWPETYNEIVDKVLAIKVSRLKMEKPTEPWELPDEIFCPFNAKIMVDPVILATGETYDRRFIGEWMQSGNHTCPLTQEVLTNDALIPNRFAQRTISKWCSKYDTVPMHVNETTYECPVFDEECNLLNSLVNNLSSPSHIEKKLAVKGLRIVLKDKKSIRAFVGEKAGVVGQLVNVLSDPVLEGDLEAQENVVTALFNLSILDSNRTLIGGDSQALRLLIGYLSEGSLSTRCNATAAISILSDCDPTRKNIGELDAIGPLMQNLKDGDMELKKGTIEAIFQTCIYKPNRAIAVEKGAVALLLEMIKGEVLVSESLSTLALLARHKEGTEQILQLDGVACLLGIMRINRSAGQINKENAVSILHSIRVDHSLESTEVLDEVLAMMSLLQTGTSKVKVKAEAILLKLKKQAHRMNVSSCPSSSSSSP